MHTRMHTRTHTRTHARRLATAALAAVVPLAGAASLAPAADAATASRITVATSDATVSSGEQLVLSGRLSPGGVVRVQSLGADGWTSLSGAVVHTRRDGTYAVRVVLGRTGHRTLRVVGDPDAAGVRNSRARIAITVG